MREDQEAALRLAFTPRLGARTLRKLLDEFVTPERALAAAPHRWKKAGVSEELARAACSRKVFECARTAVERCRRFGIGIVTIGSAPYPHALAAIFDPPPVLYLLGRLPDHEAMTRSVAIVGTRKASDHGRAFAYRVAAELSEMGAVVVSGLATGIDAEAHKGVVDRQGVGIAVLAGGLDRVHPWANRGLARDLCERGCLLSEHPPGTSPRRGYFAGRNRLISGLSRALAVVEAGVGSGALLTAEFALEQGRPVFVMPGRPGDLRVAGSLPLLRDGANLLLSALDIAAELGLEAEGLDRAPLREVGDDGTLFAGKGASLDAMVAASGLSAPLLLARLSQLELAGRIRRGDDGLYYRV